MAHPPTVDPAAPHVERVRRLALALPGAQEKSSHGAPAFFASKVFASVTASERVGADLVGRDRALCVLLDASFRVTAPARLVRDLDAR